MGGEFVGIVTWHGSEISQEVESFPPAGSTPLLIGLGGAENPSASARFVERDRVGGDPNDRLACPDLLEFEVELRMVSDDGAIDARWETTVEFALGADETLNLVVDPIGPDNTGTFQARLNMPHAWDHGTDDISLFGTFGHDFAAGRIQISASREIRSSGGLEEGVILQAIAATWEAERP